MIVTDASVVVTAIVDDGTVGHAFRDRLAADIPAAPELMPLEVGAVLRGWLPRGLVTAARARQALDDLRTLPVELHSHRALLERCWELRENVTFYDATYVALAEVLGATLLTSDARLARAPGIRCAVEVLA